MSRALIAASSLLVVTVALCCGGYPLLLLLAAPLFPATASGSLVDANGADAAAGAARGSRLIAQPFTSPTYFWPRPSAASYNATASGGSNLGANNPRLRDRVCRQLGPMVVYKAGSASAGSGTPPRSPQQDIDAWFAAAPDRAARWAAGAAVGPADWAKTDLSGDAYGLQGRYILQWSKDHPEVIAAWKEGNPDATGEPKPEDLVVPFFASFAAAHPGRWPGVVEGKDADGLAVRRIEPVASDPALHAHLFDLWVSDPSNAEKAADLEPAPVDMVTTSGSGLDPHITLRNALCVYQLDRVAASRTPAGGDVAKTREAVEALVRGHAFTPLSGLAGEPLVNVLEVNLDLDARFPAPAASGG